jgi:hypothetical protein
MIRMLKTTAFTYSLVFSGQKENMNKNLMTFNAAAEIRTGNLT